MLEIKSPLSLSVQPPSLCYIINGNIVAYSNLGDPDDSLIEWFWEQFHIVLRFYQMTREANFWHPALHASFQSFTNEITDEPYMKAVKDGLAIDIHEQVTSDYASFLVGCFEYYTTSVKSKIEIVDNQAEFTIQDLRSNRGSKFFSEGEKVIVPLIDAFYILMNDLVRDLSMYFLRWDKSTLVLSKNHYERRDIVEFDENEFISIIEELHGTGTSFNPAAVWLLRIMVFYLGDLQNKIKNRGLTPDYILKTNGTYSLLLMQHLKPVMEMTSLIKEDLSDTSNFGDNASDLAKFRYIDTLFFFNFLSLPIDLLRNFIQIRNYYNMGKKVLNPQNPEESDFVMVNDEVLPQHVDQSVLVNSWSLAKYYV